MHKLGIVDFEVPYADGRRNKVALVDQMVPAYALRRRAEPDKPDRDIGAGPPGS